MRKYYLILIAIGVVFTMLFVIIMLIINESITAAILLAIFFLIDAVIFLPEIFKDGFYEIRKPKTNTNSLYNMENVNKAAQIEKCPFCGGTDFAQNIWAYNMPAIAPAFKTAAGKNDAEQVTTDICRKCGTLRFYVTDGNRNWRTDD